MNQSGFTLVELLVVVAIVSLLLALSTTAFNRSRQAARSVVCLSQLRQIGLLVSAYTHESEGWIPTLINRESRDDPSPAIDTALGGDDVNARVFACPADRDRLYETTGTSYFWNFTVNGQHIQKLFSIAGGDNPHLIPLLADKEGFHPELRDRVNTLYADTHVAKELTFVDAVGEPIDVTPPPDADLD